MTNVLKMAVLAATVALGMSCGGGNTSCTVGSGANLACVEYAGIGAESFGTACTASGNVAGGGCSHAGAIGACRVTATAGGFSLSSTTWFYSASNAGTAASLQSSCASNSNGTWVNP
jgi:hypothetical protein